MKILKRGMTVLGMVLLCSQLPIIFAKAETDNSTEEGFRYTVTGDTVEITGYTGENGDITIPAEIDGKKVTSIAQEAFVKNEILTEVVISDGIESIGGKAFSQCINLKSVSIPATIKEWKRWSYSGQNKESQNWAFQDCRALETVTFAEGIAKLGENIFEGCTSLLSVKVPKSVTDITKTFNESSVQEVEFAEGSALTAIQSYAFAETPLTDIVIPENVGQIDASAFRNCKQLKTVTLPESITLLESGSFQGCSSIEKITLRKNLSIISNYVFYDTSLKTINITSENLSWVANKEAFPEHAVVYAKKDTTTWNTLLNTVNGGEVNGWVILEPFDKHPHEDTVEILENATCETPGKQKKTCAVCGRIEESEIPAVGHRYEVTKTVAPTTTAEGYILKTCAVCKKQIKEMQAKITAQNISTAGSQTSVTAPKVKKVKKLKVKAYKKKKCKVKWKKLSGISGYRIQYSKKKSFKKAKTKMVSAKKKKCILKKLKSKKKYYVRIQAYKTYKDGNETKIVYGAWSKKKKVKIK